MAGEIQKCSKCGEECVLGINATMQKGEVVCDDCSQVRRGFAGLLLPEERKALKHTLQQDMETTKNEFHSSLMRKALEDVQ